MFYVEGVVWRDGERSWEVRSSQVGGMKWSESGRDEEKGHRTHLNNSKEMFNIKKEEDQWVKLEKGRGEWRGEERMEKKWREEEGWKIKCKMRKEKSNGDMQEGKSEKGYALHAPYK